MSVSGARFFIIIAVALLLAAPPAAASGMPVDIKRMSASADRALSVITVSVGLEAESGASHANLRAYVPGAGTGKATRLDFSRNSKRSVHVEIPYEYEDAFGPYVRIVVSTDEGRRIRHVPIHSK